MRLPSATIKFFFAAFLMVVFWAILSNLNVAKAQCVGSYECCDTIAFIYMCNGGVYDGEDCSAPSDCLPGGTCNLHHTECWGSFNDSCDWWPSGACSDTCPYSGQSLYWSTCDYIYSTPTPTGPTPTGPTPTTGGNCPYWCATATQCSDAGGTEYSAGTPFCAGTDICCIAGECFSSDTQILTPDGYREIEDIKYGDIVSSYNTKTDNKSEVKVNKIYKTSRDIYYKIRTKDGNELKVTAEHPLYSIQNEPEFLSFWDRFNINNLLGK